MASFSADNKDQFIDVLLERLRPHVESARHADLARFARHFFGIVPLAELAQRHDSDLIGCTLASWRFFQEFDGKEQRIRVFNPDTQQHGWQSTHSVIELIHPDLPFLVDSVRIELKRQGKLIHTLQNSVMCVDRDAAGRLGTIHEGRSADADVESGTTRAESFMFIEIDRCSDPSELKGVQQGISEALAYVRAAVSDFAPMQARLRELVDALRSGSMRAAENERGEAVAFLEWLLEDHFTFLGYECFEIERGLGEGRLGVDRAQSLGVSAHDPLEDSIEGLPEEVIGYLRAPLLLSFAKASRFSRVHRPAYPDYVSVRQLDAEGRVEREHRFMGLYTSRVYSSHVDGIPYLRLKVARIREELGLDRRSHLGKELDRVLQVLPRDDLFQMAGDVLRDTVLSIVQIQERARIRLFLRRGNYGRFYYCLVFVPRDLYSTDIRTRIQRVLMQRLNSQECEFWTYFSESVLTRTQFILRVDPTQVLQVDQARLEHDVIQACRNWHDDLADRLHESLGEGAAIDAWSAFGGSFPAGYSERFTTASAVVDLQHLLALTEEEPLAMSFYQPLTQKTGVLHCKLYHLDEPLPLSDVMPILENLGLRVMGEFPFGIQRADGRTFWIHDFEFTYALDGDRDIQEVNQLFRDAFIAVWRGQAENDAFNRLVLLANMNWREVALLRTYARYIKQIRMGFELPYLANTLVTHSTISRELVRLFRTRFYLARRSSGAELEERLERAIIGALDGVAVLNEDRILRRYLDLIKATLRTNFFQTDAQGQPRDYISIKLDPQRIPELPEPRPMYEIYVYSPRFEGVHLRGGKVARGGLRWSDREEDYRTEVLGLVKAQQVKNAVIVPVGAKGGFVPRRLPGNGSRDEIQQEAIACYRSFIRGLLDLTDNLVEGQVVPPPQVIRHDEDDPYLVVAADKGTASFSDIANGIAAEYGFWLGDAFASGGSAGYDHKEMGITARGAWVSVQRHFRELGIDVQREPISVLGIGDMAGDVFGNGLLRSRTLKLVAAFNHMHIFIDPEPDPERSFVERERLYGLPRSSWADYDPSLISEGGGVFPRSLKQIQLTPQMQSLFDIAESSLTPAELIHRLLKAPVDLIWNGGIGTYVKASSESHADAGDKSNDAVRVDGRDLRCRVIGEGGNLGMTQRGRIEFALKGGAVNTDFIDNAGGVDCSDHEVNIKILLNEVVAAQDMTAKQRNTLLASMTEEVAALVLANNYKQTQAISMAEQQARQAMGEYRRFITAMEASGKLNRALEFIPDDEQLADRSAQGRGLTRPELSVLISYSKADLKETLAGSSITEDGYIARELETAFPEPLVRDFGKQLLEHRLRREIIATQLANDLVNHMGITFLRRLEQSTGAPPSDIAAAYVVARDVFSLRERFAAIEQLDLQVPPQVQFDLMNDLVRLGRRATRWFIRNRRRELNPVLEIEHFGPHIQALTSRFESLLEGPVQLAWQTRFDSYRSEEVPEDLARFVAGTAHFYTMLGIIEAAEEAGQEVEHVARVFFALGSELQLPWFAQLIQNLAVENHWQALARESYRDDLDWQVRSMTVAALQSAGAEQDVAQTVELWLQNNRLMVQRWHAMLIELKSAAAGDYPMISVAMRELLDLAQSSRQSVGGAQCSN
jgi:glutamate dehydrogenase